MRPNYDRLIDDVFGLRHDVLSCPYGFMSCLRKQASRRGFPLEFTSCIWIPASAGMTKGHGAGITFDFES